MKFLRTLYDVVSGVVVIVFALAYFYWFLKCVWEPVAPIVTVLLVLLGTIASFTNRKTAALCVGGLILYVASWPAVAAWGVWLGMMVWLLGVAMWFSGAFRPFDCLQTKTV